MSNFDAAYYINFFDKLPKIITLLCLLYRGNIARNSEANASRKSGRNVSYMLASDLLVISELIKHAFCQGLLDDFVWWTF